MIGSAWSIGGRMIRIFMSFPPEPIKLVLPQPMSACMRIDTLLLAPTGWILGTLAPDREPVDTLAREIRQRLVDGRADAGNIVTALRKRRHDARAPLAILDRFDSYPLLLPGFAGHHLPL